MSGGRLGVQMVILVVLALVGTAAILAIVMWQEITALLPPLGGILTLATERFALIIRRMIDEYTRRFGDDDS